MAVPTLPTRPIEALAGVGPSRARMLNRLGIHTINDLLDHLPRRYEEVGGLKTLAQAAADLGAPARVRVRVLSTDARTVRPGLHMTTALLSDETGNMTALWFNQPYVRRWVQPGRTLILTGKVELYRRRLQLTNPEIADAAQGADQPPLLPVYPATTGLNQRVLRGLMATALDKHGDLIVDPLPPSMASRLGLPSKMWAVAAVHRPASMDEAEKARRRLAFEELFLYQLALSLLRRDVTGFRPGRRHRAPEGVLDRLYAALPYEPTAAQRRVIDEVLADMAGSRPMYRLVQGDVGSGKTLVAAVALAAAGTSGSQAALMAPTELLAQQHYDYLAPLLGAVDVETVLLTGSTTAAQRRDILARLEDGRAQVVVGTHALLEDQVRFRSLGLVITDEQHRFGVRQRSRLQDKGHHPDVMVMTATPIPRTLALTLYGDLDLSVIDQLPPGRKPCRTFWVTREKRGQAYGYLRREVRRGRQAYVVCPLIEDSADSDLKAAVDLHRRLQRHMPDVQVGLLHGRMPAAEKHEVMRAFRDGETKVLVTTTVVEVGVDVPQATVMLVEDADRFGLAQLHQLRGRVGRGSHPGTCLLLADPATAEGRERLRIMEKHHDGFLIAERDMELRGPGEVFGTRQHGLPSFKAANPFRDADLLPLAHREARRLADEDPALAKAEHGLLRAVLMHRYETYIGLGAVG